MISILLQHIKKMIDDDPSSGRLHLENLWVIWYIPTRYPINYYLLIKHRMVFLCFLHPRWVLQWWIPPSICEKCGSRRTTLHGTILVEQQRYDIRQSTFDIRDWNLLYISFVLVVWGYLEDPILVDVQNEHMICTKCYVVSSPGIKWR